MEMWIHYMTRKKARVSDTKSFTFLRKAKRAWRLSTDAKLTAFSVSNLVNAAASRWYFSLAGSSLTEARMDVTRGSMRSDSAHKSAKSASAAASKRSQTAS